MIHNCVIGIHIVTKKWTRRRCCCMNLSIFYRPSRPIYKYTSVSLRWTMIVFWSLLSWSWIGLYRSIFEMLKLIIIIFCIFFSYSYFELVSQLIQSCACCKVQRKQNKTKQSSILSTNTFWNFQDIDVLKYCSLNHFQYVKQWLINTINMMPSVHNVFFNRWVKKSHFHKKQLPSSQLHRFHVRTVIETIIKINNAHIYNHYYASWKLSKSMT